MEKMKKERKATQDQLLIGQVVSEAEQKIVRYILKETDLSSDNVTISNIGHELGNKFDPKGWGGKVFTSQEQMDIASTNWDTLENELKLDRYFYCAISNLKHQRNQEAHHHLHHRQSANV